MTTQGAFVNPVHYHNFLLYDFKRRKVKRDGICWQSQVFNIFLNLRCIVNI